MFNHEFLYDYPNKILNVSLEPFNKLLNKTQCTYQDRSCMIISVCAKDSWFLHKKMGSANLNWNILMPAKLVTVNLGNNVNDFKWVSLNNLA